MPKKVYCVQQNEAPTEAVEAGTIATPVTARAESPEQQEQQLPIAKILHCYLIESNQELVRCSGDNIYINETKYLALKDSCSQVTLCHPEIIPPKYILKDESLTVKGIWAEIITLPEAKIPIKYQG